VSTNPTLSADWYINSEIYAHERQSVFGDSWVHVGYDSDIPNVGDVLSESVAEVEIEIVRTQSALLVAAALLTPMNRDSILVESFRGMIFVALDTSNCPLVEWLDQFPTALVDLPLEDLVFHSRTVRRVKCNWKTYADNFLEGYHVPSVHPEMARDADASNYAVILGSRHAASWRQCLWHVRLALSVVRIQRGSGRLGRREMASTRTQRN